MPSTTVLTKAVAGETALRVIGALPAPPTLPVSVPVMDPAAITIANQNQTILAQALEIARLHAGINLAHRLVTSALDNWDRYEADARRQVGQVQTVLNAARFDPTAPIMADRRQKNAPQTVGKCPECEGDLYRRATLCCFPPVPGAVAGVVDICDGLGHTFPVAMETGDEEEGPQ
jgi:hypothetical protein